MEQKQERTAKQRRKGPSSQFRVLPFGTCRLRNPLLRLPASHGIAADFSGIYGFVHCAREVIQQIAFRRGEVDISSDLSPFVGDIDAARARRTTSTHVDIALVEISSLKELRFRDIFLQLNRLNEVFQDRRSLFDAIGRFPLAEQLEERRSYLMTLPEFSAATEGEQAVLTETSLHTQSDDEMLLDMQQILDLLPVPVLFVTHCDMPNAQGRVLPNRHKAIVWVERNAALVNAPVYNPTGSMRRFGQVRAMQNEGRDTTHYTEEFEQVVGKELVAAARAALAETTPRRPTGDSCDASAAWIADIVDRLGGMDGKQFLDIATKREHFTAAAMAITAGRLSAAGNINAALRNYRRVLDLKPNSDASILAAGDLLARHDSEEAAHILAAIHQADGRPPTELLSRLRELVLESNQRAAPRPANSAMPVQIASTHSSEPAIVLSDALCHRLAALAPEYFSGDASEAYQLEDVLGHCTRRLGATPEASGKQRVGLARAFLYEARYLLRLGHPLSLVARMLTAAAEWAPEVLNLQQEMTSVQRAGRRRLRQLQHNEEGGEDIERAAREVLQFAPDDLLALRSIGRVLVRSGRWSEALPVWLQLVELEPDAVQSWAVLARVLKAIGRLEASLQAAEQALQLDPSNRVALQIRTTMRQACGRASTPAQAE